MTPDKLYDQVSELDDAFEALSNGQTHPFFKGLDRQDQIKKIADRFLELASICNEGEYNSIYFTEILNTLFTILSDRLEKKSSEESDKTVSLDDFRKTDDIFKSPNLRNAQNQIYRDLSLRVRVQLGKLRGIERGLGSYVSSLRSIRFES
jgi:hypothetical protein